ncbi:hypothetical protein ACHQM5_004593 [Ranunculus cassubicifolius]
MSGKSKSSHHNNNGGGGGTKISSIPSTSRKVVQSLKEIVSRSEDEIYLALQECNMDPNEAINRLLSQDTFQEVKSRREKKKEVKETPDPRPRGFNTAPGRGGSGGATRYDGRSGYTQFNSSDSGASRAKTAYKKENGTDNSSFSSTSGYGLPSANPNRSSGSYSSVAAEYKPQPSGTTEGVSSSSQPSPVYQPAWVGVPGQVSMADIVKRGRQKPSATPNLSNDTSHSFNNAGPPAASYHNVNHLAAPAPSLQESHHGFETSQEFVPKVSESIQGSDVHATQHASHDEWNMPEESSVRGAPVLEPSANVEDYTDPSIQSNSQSDRANLHLDSSWPDEVRGVESDASAEHLNNSYIRSSSASGRQIPSDSTGATSHFDEDSFNNMNSYQPQLHTFEQHEVNDASTQSSIPNYSVSPVEDVNVAVSSAAANLQQLSLQEERGVRSAEPSVKMPDHLQIPAEISHLSFGSFGARFSGSYGSNSLKSNLEETSVAPSTASPEHSVNRAPEYFGDEGLQSTSEGNVASTRTSANTYDSLSQSELMKQQDGGESIHAHQYSFPTSVPSGYTLDNNNAQLNSAFPYEQTNSQMQNIPLSTVMQAYSNSLQGAPNVQSARESADHSYSAFLASQAMPTKYNTAASSINGPSLSMPENVKPSMFSLPPHQTLGTGPALPQHLAVHPYTQPTLPLGHFAANMIHGYPYHLPQSFAYMPPAYQQAYAAAYGAGGGFGSSLNLPGSFPLNPSTTNTSTSLGYDDLMSSQQYKESSQQFLPLQQNDNSTVWVQGPGSRQVSAVPASTYYSFQGQQQAAQQHSGFRQAQQQPSQHYGNMSYQNFYHSQPGVSQEQQQTPNEGALSASQGGPQSKQSQQLWQHSY